jgi:Fe(3+) dicitrate transport protein
MARDQFWARGVLAIGVAFALSVLPAGAEEASGVPAEPQAAEEAASTGAAAADPAPDPADPVRLPGLTVIGSPEAVFQLPGSGAFIEAEEFREQSYDDPAQVLRAVPGVYFRQEDGFGLFPNLSLRGVDTTRSSKITVMEDGVLAAPAPYASPAAYYRPTIGRMSGIEVLKGSSQVRFGPHTTGGVINYLSTPIPEARKGYLRTLYGRENEARVHAWFGDDVETEIGRWGYVVEGYLRRTDGFKTIDDAPDFGPGNDTGFLLAEPMIKLSWTPDSERRQRFEFKFGYTYLDADETYLGLSESDFRDDPFRRYNSSRFDEIESQQYRSYLRHFIDAGHGVNLTTTAYGSVFERNWYKLNDLRNVARADGMPGTINMDLSSALAGANGGFGLEVLKGQRAGTLRVRNNDREYYLWGVESVADRTFETGGFVHEVSLGIRYHSDRESRDQQDELFQQDATGRIIGHTFGPRGGAGHRWEQTDAIAVFIEDVISWKQWTFRPGFRYEQLWLEYNDKLAGVRDEGDMGVWAPGLGVTYDVTEQWMLLGGVYRGFSVPSPLDHLVDGLDEETSLSTELGARYQDAGRALDATLIGFYTAFEDLIVVDNIGGAGTGVSENAGDIDAYGLELALQFDLGANRGWSFSNPYFVNFTWTRALLDGDSRSTNPESVFSGGEDGNEVPYIPEYMVNFGTGIEFSRWGFSAIGTWISEVYTTASNTTRQENADGLPDARFGTADSHFLLDLAAHVKVREGLKLIGGIQNVTDEEYVASRHPAGPRPGQRRFAHVGFEFEF